MRASGKYLGYLSRSSAALLTAVAFLVALCGFAPAGAQNVRPNIVLNTSSVLGTFTSAGTLAGADPAGSSFAVNSNGDVIVGTTFGNEIDLFSQAKGTVTVIGTYGNVSALSVDSANNLYIGDLYNVGFIKLPYIAGAYVTFTAPVQGGYTPPNCTGNDTVECAVQGTQVASNGYYFGSVSSVFDAAGDLFFATNGSGGTAPFSIFECTAACLTTGTPGAVLLYTEPTSTTQSTTGQLTLGGIAVGPAGNVFFTDSAVNSAGASFSSNLKELMVTGGVYSATPTTIYTYTVAAKSVAASDDQVDGVVTDANNVYFVTQYDGIYGFPNNAGVVVPANIFAVSTQGAKSMASDGKGNFYLDYYVNATGKDVMGKISVGALNAGTGTVGTASTLAATTIDNTGTCTTITGETFTSSIPDYSAVTSGTCASTGIGNTAGSFATYPTTITFKATANGTRTGTLTATDNLASTGTATVTGTGTGGTTATVATPTFSPAGGTFTATQTVALSDTTAGASIYYTTNGTAPTASSTLYTGPITVSSTTTIMAIGVATGSTNSAVASATYTITQAAAATPTFTPAAGTYTSAQTVTIASTTPTATIYYTTNGTAPTTSSTVYTGPVTVGASETLMAIATATGFGQSAVGSAAYVINLPAAATPTFSPVAGTYTSVQTVTISDTTAAAKIYYTLDGSTPTTSSTLYTAPISVGVSETINALATAANFTNSAVGTAAYVINLPAAATPAFSVAGGTYNSNQSVTLSDTTAGSTIYYTVDGSTPTTKSTVYTTPITVSASETITAIATANGSSTSAAGSATYTLVAATPTISPAAGTYTTVQTVTLADATVGTAIYYTTNGTAPTAASTLYNGPITVGTSQTIMAIATLTGYSSSAVASAAYVINLPAAATPTFTPAAGTYTTVQTVMLNSTTPGSMIYYTTNGTVPTTASTLYAAPISVGVSETIMAIAVASGSSTSAVGSAAYVINLPVSVPAATPTFSPAGGTYAAKQTVTISSTTPGAMIYYTLNGSTPTTSSTLYTAPITVSVSETVNAIAVATGFVNSATGTAVYTITASANPSFSLAINPAALTVMDGASGTVAVSIIPTAGYSSAVTLSCSGLPSGSTCTFAPATVTPSGNAPATSTLTVAAAARTSSLQAPGFGLGSVASGTAFAGMLCLLGFRKRRRVQLFLLLLVGVIGLGMMTGCGSSTTINHNPVLTSVTVTATDGTLTTSTVLSLTVN